VRRRWETVKAEQGERAGAKFHDVGPLLLSYALR